MANEKKWDDDRGSQEAIDFGDLFIVLWRGRWLIAVAVVVCAGAAFLASVLLPKRYSATVVLSPVTNQASGGLGALGSALSQFGGVASLAGINLGAEASARAEAIATLESEALTSAYIRDKNLLPILFRGAWDASARQWKPEVRTPPTLWVGNAYFASKVRDVTENSKTGLVTMQITWSDPKQAAEWANGLVELTNNYLRQKAIQESRRNIAYLNEQATKTNVVELRSALYALMESEIKKEMMARGSNEYALKVVDPAVPPEAPSFPKRLLFLAAGLVAGLMLGVLAAAVRHSFGQRRAAAATTGE